MPQLFWILKNWLKQCFEFQIPIIPDKEAIASLIGLGPGLTPSGDDFLGGAMLALHAIGKGDICSLLWSKIGSYVAASTNSISLAHLKAASDGMGSDLIHRALSTIASGDVYALEPSIAGIGRIGYSSGWDIISGSIAVLDSWLDSECRNATNG